ARATRSASPCPTMAVPATTGTTLPWSPRTRPATRPGACRRCPWARRYPGLRPHLQLHRRGAVDAGHLQLPVAHARHQRLVAVRRPDAECGGRGHRRAPPAVTLTLPTSSSTGSYTVSWTSSSGATHYELSEQVGSGSWSVIQDTSVRSRANTSKTNCR